MRKKKAQPVRVKKREGTLENTETSNADHSSEGMVSNDDTFHFRSLRSTMLHTHQSDFDHCTQTHCAGKQERVREWNTNAGYCVL